MKQKQLTTKNIDVNNCISKQQINYNSNLYYYILLYYAIKHLHLCTLHLILDSFVN